MKSNNCRGSVSQGTGCTICGKCLSELSRIKRENRQAISTGDISRLEDDSADPQHREILRLARVGLWAEENSVAIDDGIRLALGELPKDRIAPFEKALWSRPEK